MRISDFNIEMNWPNGGEIVWSKLTPHVVPYLSDDFKYESFYHQQGISKPIPPKSFNLTFNLGQDADIYNYLKSFFTSKSRKYYGLYSLKDKGWIYIHNRMLYAKNKNVLRKKYIKMINNLIPLYTYEEDSLIKYQHDKNVVIKPFWL